MIRVTLGLLCWTSVFSFLLRGSGGKRRHKDPSFQVPLAPGLRRKWDLERSKLVTKLNHFVNFLWIMTQESWPYWNQFFYLIWNLVCCVVPCGSGSTNYLFWLCPRFKFLKSWGNNKSPVSTSFFFSFFALPALEYMKQIAMTERFSNCPSMASMTN